MADEKRLRPPVPPTETVEVPLSLLQQLQARLDILETRERTREEMQGRPHVVLDAAWEAERAQLARSSQERTQEAADKKYGTTGQRFLVRLDSTDAEGKPGPNITEHFPLMVAAHGELEAGAFYLDLMGIKKHDYRIVATPLVS